MASKKSERGAREARDRLRAYTARQEVHRRQTRRRIRDNVIAVAGLVVVAAGAGLAQYLYFSAGPGYENPDPSASLAVGAPDPDLAEHRLWTGELVFNDEVRLGIEIDGAAAPQAASVFLRDVQDGYFPGKSCHRLASTETYEFLQCGSIDGEGGPDPELVWGPIENSPEDDLYPAGTIVMVRDGGLGYTHGHQFFITTIDSTIPQDSAGGFTVVGQVTSGLEDFAAAFVAPGMDPDSVELDGTAPPIVPVSITDAALE